MTSTDQKIIIEKLLEQRNNIASNINMTAFWRKDTSGLVAAIQSIDTVLIAWSKPSYAPLQLCPICHGGQAFFPPGKSCSLCNGRKVVAHEVIEPKT